MRYADIKKVDIANGTGVRVSLFVHIIVKDVLIKKHGILTMEKNMMKMQKKKY